MCGTHNLSSGFRAKKGSLSTRISGIRKDGSAPKTGFSKKSLPIYPFALVHEHKKTAERFFRQFAGKLNDKIFPMLARDIPKYSDSHRSDADDIFQLLAELRSEYGEWIDQTVLEEKIRENLSLIDLWTSGQTNQSLSDQYKEKYGSVLAGISAGTAPDMIQVNPKDPAALENVKTAARNQRLAQNELYAKHFQEVEKIISDGIVNGKTKDEITKDILDKVDVNANRAKFWAEDQTAIFQSEQTRLRQNRAGITHYIWITSGTRTRPSHAVHTGKTISWSVGVGNLARPGARHAGQDYKCHCVPDPIYPDRAAELGLSPNSNGSPKEPVANISGPLSTEQLVGNYYGEGSGLGVQGSAVRRMVSDDWARANLSAKFSILEIDAVNDWQSGNWEDIVSYLRKEDVVRTSGQIKALESRIANLDAAIEKSVIPENFTVLSGIEDFAKTGLNFDLIQTGQVLDMDTYLASSLSEDIARKFTDSAKVIYEISLKKGQKGLYVNNAVLMKQHEMEVLLKRDQLYFVVDKYEKDGFRYIRVEIIEQ